MVPKIHGGQIHFQENPQSQYLVSFATLLHSEWPNSIEYWVLAILSAIGLRNQGRTKGEGWSTTN